MKVARGCRLTLASRLSTTTLIEFTASATEGLNPSEGKKIIWPEPIVLSAVTGIITTRLEETCAQPENGRSN